MQQFIYTSYKNDEIIDAVKLCVHNKVNKFVWILNYAV